jgi:hypothetical protein
MEKESGNELMAPRAELGPRPRNRCMAHGRIWPMAPRPTAPCYRRGHHALAGRDGVAATHSPVAEPWQGLAIRNL